MATIYVDNQAFQVKDGQNLLHACLTLGMNLPYFCWHPAMGSVGACRQCAVKQFKDENDTRGRLVMACMTAASNNARISILDPEAVAFRAGIIEFLMENHPHDCPVCDEGGECHLQDMTVMTGHVYRAYRFPKRTYRNQDLGPLVNHEMNRCIQCYRCVRYYNDYADGRDFGVFGAHDHVYFGRKSDGVLESEFSGNLVEVCPTGVFTDKTLRFHYTRKWDLQTAPSICTHCSLGCNTIPGERYGDVRRIRNRFNGDVNGYFLCDRGRYGYEFVNSVERVRWTMHRTEMLTDPAGQAAVLAEVAELVGDGSRTVGIGSPRASLEANFALMTLVGPEHFYTGMSAGESHLVGQILQILRAGPARTPSLQDVRDSDAVLVLGEDVTNVAPVLALAIRQATRNQPKRAADKARIPPWDDHAVRELIQNARGPLFIGSVGATRLDDVATETYHGAPDDLARLGFAVAHALDPAAPWPDKLDDEVVTLVERIALALQAAEKPLIVAGTSCGSPSTIEAAANVAMALIAIGKPAQLSYTVPEANSLGVGMLAPAGRPPAGDLEAAFQAILSGAADTLIILENDLYLRADAEQVDAVLQAAKHVIVLDHLRNATVGHSEVTLPAATFAESDGTLVNNEGRAQRFYQVLVTADAVQESWRWLRDVAIGAGRLDAGAWPNLDAVSAALVAAHPDFQAILEIAPPASFRIAGEKIAREPARYSGRTAVHVQIDVHEPKPPADPDSPLNFSMEGFQGEPPPALIPRFWAPGWNSIQALNRFQDEVGGPLKGGNPGRRLIEPGPTQEGTPQYFDRVPTAFRRQQGKVLLVPLYHIFGSDELSVLSEGISQLTPKPYLALSLEDASRQDLHDGDEREFVLGGEARHVTVKIRPDLPPGIAGVPANLPGLRGISLPGWSDLT